MKKNKDSGLLFMLICVTICAVLYMTAFHSKRNECNELKQEIIQLKEKCGYEE